MANIGGFTSYFNFKIPRAFGVDFNNEIIKVFQIKDKGKHIEIAGWNKKRMAKGVVRMSEIQNKEQFAEVLLDAVHEAKKKIKGKGAIVSIPEHKAFTRILSIPLMDESEAMEAIKWEAEANMPISIEEVYYDWQIVKREKDTMKVLVLACPKKLIDNYLEAFEFAGLEVLAFEAECIATGRSVLLPKDTEPTIIVDIGLEDTNFSIFSDGYPVFTSSGMASGRLMTDAVSKQLGIDEAKAESYKIRYGLGSTKKEKEENLKFYRSILLSLVTDIQKTINFYEEKMGNGNRINKILLSGGGSNLKGIVQYIAMHFNLSVMQADPWVNVTLGKGIPPIPKEEAQSFTTSIGLALRAQNYEGFN